ncbi:NUDIX hydrolase [Facklamia miroungae]|uniref:ADP-ribose pyrophosphatase YjhB, NUDIX family n=1 Tax=Facklamia miroungae TaxID=120956 RepID=A0A1G7UUA4_9LACT|nr:ADP-ribose pyrophosphatase YjhB, NUDIX family [Facklamia miroungae]
MENKYSVSNHFGVYGTVTDNGKILCIHKNAGPYKNRYDLPGGSQENWEGLTETLSREFVEETGYTIKKYSNPRVYDTFVREKGNLNVVHHIMVFYDVELDNNIEKQDLPSCFLDGFNDSDGIARVPFENFNEANSSPLLIN